MIAKEISDTPKALRLMADQITAPDHIRDKHEIAYQNGEHE